MKKLVIFDLDGTLLNTIEDLGMATNHALEQCGYPTHSLESYNMMVGNGVSKLIERALPEECRSHGVIEKVRGYFMEYYSQHLTDFTKPYPGITDLLKDLNTLCVCVAVASNKYQEAVSELIGRLFPDIVWGAVEGHREGIPTKPDPSIVFNILSLCPTPKADVLYVGDSGVDMETARRACVESVGVTWGFRPVSELRDNHADHIIYNPEAIIPLITSDSPF